MSLCAARKRGRRRAVPAAVALFVLPLAAGVVKAQGPVGPVTLESVIADPAADPAGRLGVDSAALLALDEDSREAVGRWVRRGGVLALTGDAVDTALDAFGAVRPVLADGTHAVGLGRILGPDAPAVPVVSPTAGRIPAALSRLARADLTSHRELGTRAALRIGGYALLLALGYGVSRSAAWRWRLAGALSLALVFGAWPWWSGLAPGTGEAWHQADVVVASGSGPALVWSAAASRPAGHRWVELSAGAGAWSLVVEGTGRPPADADVAIETRRGTALELSWLADVPFTGGLGVELTREAGRLRGWVRNDTKLVWTAAWLLIPARAPLLLDDLAPGNAVVIDAAAPPAAATDEVLRELVRDLPPARARLLREVFHRAGLPLLAAGRPVLLAWAAAPWHPLQSADGALQPHGSTLMLSAERSST